MSEQQSIVELSVNDDGYPGTQDANISAHEAALKPCPLCGCVVIHLHNIDSFGFFGRVKCTKCSASATPKDWQNRVLTDQPSLFGDEGREPGLRPDDKLIILVESIMATLAKYGRPFELFRRDIEDKLNTIQRGIIAKEATGRTP